MATILILEDELPLAVAWSELLRDAGHDVEVVRTATDALDRVADARFDLLITDIFVRDEQGRPTPDGGLRLIGTLRAKKSLPEYCWLKTMPIIAVSGTPKSEANTSALDMARAVGAHVVLEKPVTWETLVANVAVLVARAERGALAAF